MGKDRENHGILKTKICIDCGKKFYGPDYFGACKTCPSPSDIATHGGGRKGAGRPKKEKTKRISVPISKLPEIKKILKME